MCSSIPHRDPMALPSPSPHGIPTANDQAPPSPLSGHHAVSWRRHPPRLHRRHPGTITRSIDALPVVRPSHLHYGRPGAVARRTAVLPIVRPPRLHHWRPGAASLPIIRSPRLHRRAPPPPPIATAALLPPQLLVDQVLATRGSSAATHGPGRTPSPWQPLSLESTSCRTCASQCSK